ncbi:MAG: Tm-1-like ATP-binding domain-containing protein, partial [Planctomycetaceae bacterium]|nr:Tm-1-like ATP-binding domain-containing protein [Planctomycetaceae bacterium]
RPLIAATMFGVTTPCIEQARKILEQVGYEVLVFHATGSGGQAMESLVREGLIAGVLDITTTELADELVGGFLTAGPTRLTAAAERGVPQIVSVGATDMVNFHGPESVPERFKSRQFYQHNPSVTLMRTTIDENRRIGEDIGTKLASARAPACILLPRRGVSAIDATGQPFDDPAARGELFAAIRRTAGNTEIIELDCHINDAQFAEAAARKLLELIQLDTQLQSLASGDPPR